MGQLRAKSRGAVGFEQRAGGGTIDRRPALGSVLHFDQQPKAFQQLIAAKDAPDVGDPNGFSLPPQLLADGGCERG